MKTLLNVAFLSSRRGSLFFRMIEHPKYDRNLFRIGMVASNRVDAEILRKGKKLGFNTHLIELDDEKKVDTNLKVALENHSINFVILGGYLRKISKDVLSAYNGDIVNVHPSLLPKHGGKGMYGLAVYQSIMDSGDTETGATIHLVDGEYDTGQIISQKKFGISSSSSLEEISLKTSELELELLLDTMREASNRLNP